MTAREITRLARAAAKRRPTPESPLTRAEARQEARVPDGLSDEHQAAYRDAYAEALADLGFVTRARQGTRGYETKQPRRLVTAAPDVFARHDAAWRADGARSWSAWILEAADEKISRSR